MTDIERMPWCDFCRELDAIGWLLDAIGRREEAICADCYGELVERENAIAIAEAASPGGGARLREMLPPLRRGLGSMPKPRPLFRAGVDEEEERDEQTGETKGEKQTRLWQEFVERSEREGRRLNDEGPA